MNDAQPSPRVAFDHAALDATERLFWGDVWDATPAETADAAGAGCHLLFVETGERVPGRPDASYRNILRASFEEAYIRPNWRRE